MGYDFIIIGSGVSGGRMAQRLCEAGANCLLLEAGKAFQHDGTPFPPTEMEYSTQMFWGGGLEPAKDGVLGFLRAKCLGGTSVVNQALLDKFDDDAFEDWQAVSEIRDLNLRHFEPYYEKVLSSVKAVHIPEEHCNRNAKLFRQALSNLGYGYKPLFRAQGDCGVEKGNDCIVCLGGCPRKSKQSTLVTSIPAALKLGLTLESEVHVKEIKDGEVRAIKNGQEVRYQGKNIVLAAGSIGNTEILLRSGFKHPGLGKGFTCHPQYMTFAYFDEPVDAHKGAFQSIKSSDPKIREMGFKFENVFASPIGTSMLIPGHGKNHLEDMKKYRHLASMEVCIRDEPFGEIKLVKDKIQVTKPITDQDRKRKEAGLQLVDDLFESVGAKKLIRGKQGFGLHLMGGCSLGVDGDHSVISPDFYLHDHKNIWCADSSVFPSAPGINPSFTIMALTEMAAEKMVKQ